MMMARRALCLVALFLAGALPCSADGLAASFASLSEGIKAGSASIGAAGVPEDAAFTAFQKGVKEKYQEVENAFKGMGAMPDPAEMVARNGIWNLEMVAAEDGVIHSTSGLVWKKGLKAHLRFTQELVRSGNPYADRAAVFRVYEVGVRVSRFSRLNGDPAAVVLDLQKPSEFTTVFDAGFGGKAVKAYSCRSNDSDLILCRVEASEYAVVPLPGARVLYLGLRRAKS